MKSKAIPSMTVASFEAQMSRCSTPSDIHDWLVLYEPTNQKISKKALIDDFCEDCDLPHRQQMAAQGRCIQEWATLR